MPGMQEHCYEGAPSRAEVRMRVLLFCQTGDGRPKYIGPAYGPDDTHHRATIVRIDEAVGRGMGHNNLWATERVLSALRAADRWWLVECENAEAGRAYLLATVPGDLGQTIGYSLPSGVRILAQGGK